MKKIVDNNFIRYLVDKLRHTGTAPSEFYRITETIAKLMSYEVLKEADYSVSKIPIWTGDEYKATMLDQHKLVIMPILRAGIGMLDGVRQLLPEAQVHILGMYRDEDTLDPVWYYNKLPKSLAGLHAFLIDPMLATGGTLAGAVEELLSRGCSNISVMSIVASPAGVEKLEKVYSEVKIYIAALDRCLNENGYILPGLGDAGDRIFNTLK